MSQYCNRRFLAAVAGALFVNIWNVTGCGISWKTPISHFDGVNEQGYMMYSETITDLDFGSDFKLPLIVNFRSNRESSSPYGGYGWLIPLFESHVVQLEENRFMLVQPDGWNRYFGRKGASDTTLLGDGGWVAELKGNTFTSWASCGWKLVHINGKIFSMTTPDNRTFSWVRSGDRVTEIREGGITRLKVNWNDAGTEMVSVEADGKQFAFEQHDKPRVQSVANQNVIAAIDRSLSRIVLPDKTAKNYEFAVDQMLNPTFRVDSRLLTWSPESKRLISDGDWKYKITPSSDGGYAIFERRNSLGISQFWHNDRNKGVETVRGSDGKTITSRVFPIGRLAGKLRKREVIRPDGVVELSLLNSYNEAGNLIAQTTGYENSSRLETVEFKYDKEGRLESKSWSDGVLIKYTYNTTESRVEKFKDGMPLWTKVLSAEGKLVSMKVSEFPDIELVQHLEQDVVKNRGDKY